MLWRKAQRLRELEIALETLSGRSDLTQHALDHLLQDSAASSGTPNWITVGTLYIALTGLYVAAASAIASNTNPQSHLFLGVLALVLIPFYLSALASRQFSPLLVTLALVLGGIILYSAWVQYDAWDTLQENASNEQQIKDAVLQETNLELQWFASPRKQPSSLASYLDESTLGSRFQQLKQLVAVLQCKHEYYASNASRTLFFEALSLLPNKQTAFVKTTESYYEPLLVVRHGIAIPVQQPAGQLNLSGLTQFYILEKQKGRWKIRANVSPFSPNASCVASVKP